MNQLCKKAFLPLLVFLTSVTAANAQDAAPAFDSGDTAWMLVSALLVLMMTVPGLALFYGGLVKKDNVLATLMQSVAVVHKMQHQLLIQVIQHGCLYQLY